MEFEYHDAADLLSGVIVTSMLTVVTWAMVRLCVMSSFSGDILSPEKPKEFKCFKCKEIPLSWDSSGDEVSDGVDVPDGPGPSDGVSRHQEIYGLDGMDSLDHSVSSSDDEDSTVEDFETVKSVVDKILNDVD